MSILVVEGNSVVKQRYKKTGPQTSTRELNGRTRTIITTPSGRQADVSQHPATGMYNPIPHIWFQHPVDLPPFTFATIRAMLMDEGVRLNFETRAAPIYGLEFGWEENKVWQEGIKCRDPGVAQYIYRQLQRIWKTFLPDILRAQIWGWSAGEVKLKLSDETGLIEIDKMLSRHPMDCKLLKTDCQRWGVRIERTQGGSVDLPFPYAWFHAYGAEDGEDYGTSAAYGAYSPWSDKWFDGGAKEVRRLFMHKDAFGGADLGYPDGETFLDGYENPIPNRDIARRIVESIRAGGVTVRPSERDEHGNEKWPLTRATVASNPQHILQYPKDLDEEIRHGMGIPDDVINSGTTGSWNGKAIPLQSFYASLDSWVVRILCDLCEQIIDPLLELNYGKKLEYETPFKSLAKEAMEQQQTQQDKPVTGQPQDSPYSQVSSLDTTNQQPAMPESTEPATVAMSLSEQIGRGELTMAEIIDAGAKAVAKRMSLVETEDSTQQHVEPRKFSSTQFDLPAEIAQAVLNMGSKIPDEALAKDGKELQPHITVKYGIHDDDPTDVTLAVQGFPPVSVRLGKASVFTSEEHDVVKLEVDSPQLHELNTIISGAVECTDKYPEYNPHVTIAYVKPGLGEGIAALMNDLDGIEITLDKLLFSSKHRQVTEIDLAPPKASRSDSPFGLFLRLAKLVNRLVARAKS